MSNLFLEEAQGKLGREGNFPEWYLLHSSKMEILLHTFT